MKVLEDIKALLEKELDKINKKGDISASDLEMATKVMCLLEKICIVEDMMDGGEDYSERYYGMPSYRSSYDDGMSYGHYNGYRNDYNGRGRMTSYGDRNGYSGHSASEMAVQKLEEALQNARSEKERKSIIRAIDELKN